MTSMVIHNVTSLHDLCNEKCVSVDFIPYYNASLFSIYRQLNLHVLHVFMLSNRALCIKMEQ